MIGNWRGRGMKWATLLKDFKDRVGLTQSPSSSASSPSSPTSREKHELELEFKRSWEEFRSLSSEKEKEAALNLSVDIFCRLIKKHANVAQLVTKLVETHIFSFVVGRAFFTDIEKLKASSKKRSLDVAQVLKYFSEATMDDISTGANLLTALEILVSGVEGSVVHIMKALASHPSAALSFIEDDSLLLLFQMVSNGSLIVFSLYKEGLVPLHSIQLHRHAMQILGLLLENDSGSTAKYIREHHLIKILLLAVKDFDPDSGDSAYTMGIVDLLLVCMELSYRPEAGSVRLQEDIHNAHGYQFLVQFALTVSNMTKSHGFHYSHSNLSNDQDTASDGFQNGRGQNFCEQENSSLQSVQCLSPTLSRLLDVLVSLAQTGPNESPQSYGGKGFKSFQTKGSGHHKRGALSSDWPQDELWEKDDDKIKDLEAIQMLQDIFLKANSQELQAEVLHRLHTSIGCVELLLETIYPYLLNSSPLLSYALKIVEVLGSYRYVLQMRPKNLGDIIETMEKLILMENMASENISLAPFVEMDMNKIGHAAIQVSLGKRSWPPAAGYSFVCWFQFQNLLKLQSKDTDPLKAVPSKKWSGPNVLHEKHILRIFSVGAADNDNATYAQLYLQEDGVLTLSTSNSCFFSFSCLEFEQGRWHHLAVIHSKPNALAGLFQASVAYVYLNGNLRHAGKLGYSPSPLGKPLQVTIGTSVGNARVSDLTWKLRSCYLFEEVLTPGCIFFMYILGRGYRGLFQDTDLLQFVPNRACGGGSMAILIL